MENDFDNTIQQNKVIENDLNLKNNIDLDNLINIQLKSSNIDIGLGQMFTYIIEIENNSDCELIDVNVAQKIEKKLRLCDITMGSIKLKTVDSYNEFITFYIDKIKARDTKIIEVIVEVISANDKENILSEIKLEGKYRENKQENNIIANSNTCLVNLIKPELIIRKKSLVVEAIVGDIVKFKILAENEGNVDLDNIIIRDILKPELKFLDNTIKINGLSEPNESILSGINIGLLKVGCTKEITFDAEIISRPKSGIVTNVSIGQYQYSIPGEDKLREGNAVSNENSILIQLASIMITKKCNKDNISLGDEITYIINLENDGTLEVENIVVKEEIEESLTLIDGKFNIDNQVVNNIDLSKGILIGNLKVGEKRIIGYSVKYDKASSYGRIINTTKVNFDYKQSTGLVFRGKEIENKLEVTSTISTFKYLSRSEKIYKEKDKPFIGEVDNVSADIDILEYHIVKTIEGKSNEGQKLTGYKIVLQGIIKEVIEYSSDECNRSIYITNEHIPFSTFIVLPDNFKIGSKINIDYSIEDISFERRNKVSVYTNICLLFVAKIRPYISIKS
ncbi:DUF11 domain-containing protein [Clostridium taeniosporum]|uniref:DUF11 domain-containing protein n=1 Tax=Clostridium taeniosporum TaxID=394958 RepID=A0A1D7XKZ6_9CLOT|nr:DUF11 domain-containing protein [Clostridium taeniosporum]AOR24023.1 hypothetical protein BGI42_09900 [Clostridium taeniosporum]